MRLKKKIKIKRCKGNSRKSRGSAEQKQSRNWGELPADVTSTILSKVGAFDVLTSAQRVCSSWLKLCGDPAMWRIIDMLDVDMRTVDYDLDLGRMCRHAVDRSGGQLLSFSIEGFCTAELLLYIAKTSKNLRILRLVKCEYLSEEGLSEAVQSFPLLEELELSYWSPSYEALEAVGRLCPLLKSLKLNKDEHDYYRQTEWDKDAIAISENMHELRHLQLFGNKLTNVGLQAILDGCPHLESLDLRRCFNVSLVGDLGKACAKRIKDIRHPRDSTHDYAFSADIDDDYADYSSEEDYACGGVDAELAFYQSDELDEMSYYGFDDGFHSDFYFGDDGYYNFYYDYNYDYNYMFNDD